MSPGTKGDQGNRGVYRDWAHPFVGNVESYKLKLVGTLDQAL